MNEILENEGLTTLILSLLTALVGGVITIAVKVIEVKNNATTANNIAQEAVVAAQEAASNTVGVSNGFTGSVDRKLTWIINELTINRMRDDELNKAFREHLEWHIKKES